MIFREKASLHVELLPCFFLLLLVFISPYHLTFCISLISFFVMDMHFWKRMDDFERQFLCTWAPSDILHFHPTLMR